MVIEDSTGVIVEQRVVTSDSCRDGLCSSNFSLPMDQSYIITVRADSIFAIGQSDTAVSTDLACIRLTPANQVLIAVGVVLLSIAIAACAVLITVEILKKGY